MCGIIGIKGKANAAKELFMGLLALQHRGQDSCGITTYKEERFYQKKGNGLVERILNQKEIERLKGDVGIGHVRYPTIGSGDIEDAQPFYTNSPYGITMVHNGNIVNYFELRKKLGKKRHINSLCDTEIILNIFADNLDRNPFRAARAVMDEVNGSYSVVTYIASIGLFAFRDPHAIRPICFGEKNGGYIFASESIALDVLGYNVIRDLAPGEGILINDNGRVESKIIKKGVPKHCIFEYIYFSRPESILDGLSVYEARLNLGRELAKEVHKRGFLPDTIVPIPDTARPASISLAEALGVPYREGLIKNRYVLRTFIMPREEERIRYLRYKLNPIRRELEGKKILLIDDSIVRGNTSREIISIVRRMNPKRVCFASSAPPIRHPCFYGIDIQTRRELVARNRSIEEIRKFIKADGLVYQTLEGLERAIGKKNFCSACFDGEYPTEIRGKDVMELEEEREKNF
jgi:amidophosphoribosyltransferase